MKDIYIINSHNISKIFFQHIYVVFVPDTPLSHLIRMIGHWYQCLDKSEVVGAILMVP